jgi:hypothetical protein
MISCMIGPFTLRFEPIGKMRQLLLRDGTNLLFETDYVREMGEGMYFNPAGWDECFPSIEPFQDAPTMGDLIWQAPQVHHADGQFEQVWNLPGYTAQRVFQPRGDSGLEMIFRVKTGFRPLPFLWASHALFSTDGLLSVLLPGGRRLDEFAPDGTCTKFFVRAGPPVVLERDGNRIHLETDQPFWGIWYNRGGWPIGAPGGFSCIGIEATSMSADAPTDAVLPAGGSFEGRVILRVVP